MKRLLAIDPGLAHAGIVLFAEGGIADVWTITTTGNADTDPFARTVLRVVTAATSLREIVEATSPDVVAIEAYEDFGGKHLRGVRRRWTTPLQMGAFIDVLPLERTRWQKASVVMTQYASAVAAWKRGDHVIAGDERLTNDHLRSAACHGLYAIAHERLGGVR